MKKIRIGNDIRLAVDLRQYIGNHLREREVYDPEAIDFENIDNNPFVNKAYEVYYPNQYTNQETSGNPTTTIKSAVGIRSIKAYLINTTRLEEREAYIQKKTRFVARYPIEPCFECFTSTPYNTCSSGCPSWRALPHRYCVSPYHGFGWKPEWGGIYKKVPYVDNIEYCAPVLFTDQQNVVEVCFPAEAQKYVGKYKLVIVAKVYAPGYNGCNFKTITIDAPNVLELVRTSNEAVDSDMFMGVDVQNDVLTNINNGVEVTVNDTYVDGGYSTNGDDSAEGDYITLTRTDGQTVNVDVSGLTGWYEGD